ncbi:MAG TPA: CehA/McbA family metallohydrolase [Patescibacteria group bacterium]|nr:CehA/McbA family metallohydrolase [Patescibacteria group bacterium]
MKRDHIRYPLVSFVLAAFLIFPIAPAFSFSHDLPAGDGGTAGCSGTGEIEIVTLTCVILDAASADTIAARCSVTDCNGAPRYPSLGQSFYHVPGPGYFYADGSFAISIPAGVTTVRASRGPGYGTVVRSITVSGDTTVVIAMNHAVEMDRYGWYCGDTHVHINHPGGYYLLDPADAHLMARAEGLNVVTCLDNGFYFTGGPDPCSTPRCIVSMSEERRTIAYGDNALLGLSRLIVPFSTEWSPLGDAADSAHAQQGACVVAAHPVTTDDFWDIGGWPGVGLARELPVDVTRNRVDCVEVMSYSNCHDAGVELELWYRILNCGFTLPACAGTDACMNRLESYPLGVFRTYAYIGGDSLTYDRWLRAVTAGRTFVTNGPFITSFTVAGRTMGETVFLGHGCREVPCSISITCASPLERAEIVMNGCVIGTLPLGGTRCSADTSFNLTVDHSAWLAARVYGVNTHWLPERDSLFAHTSPIYISIDGERIATRPEDASYFVDWISDLESLARSEGYWPGIIDSVHAFDEFAAAKQFYTMLSDVSTAVGEYGAFPIPALYLEQNVPNPFAGGTVINFGISPSAWTDRRSADAVGRAADLSIYDIRGRLVRRLFRRSIVPGPLSVYWDGTDGRGGRAASGIYFCRLRVGSLNRCTKMILVR